MCHTKKAICRFMQLCAIRCKWLSMPPQGLEPVAILPQETPLSGQGNAQYNALSGDDERLRLLLETWAELPESVKTAVMEMVEG